MLTSYVSLIPLGKGSSVPTSHSSCNLRNTTTGARIVNTQNKQNLAVSIKAFRHWLEQHSDTVHPKPGSASLKRKHQQFQTCSSSPTCAIYRLQKQQQQFRMADVCHLMARKVIPLGISSIVPTAGNESYNGSFFHFVAAELLISSVVFSRIQSMQLPAQQWLPNWQTERRL